MPNTSRPSKSSFDDQVAGILLAGGTGTRMQPLTTHINKHLIPVYMRPMIEYSLGTLFNMGLRRILIITGREHMGQVVQQLGSGADYGDDVDLTFKVQERAGGIAEALGLAEHFVQGRKVAVMLADNIFDDDTVYGATEKFVRGKDEVAVNFLVSMDDPRAYGVATVKDGKITKITEKPKKPESNLAVTGLYLYPGDVFAKVKRLKPSDRNELEITDINNLYIAENRLQYHEVKVWYDAGEPATWMKAQAYVSSHADRFGAGRFKAGR